MEDRTKIDMDYNEQQKINEEQFKEIIKATRPDIWAIMDTLDKTHVNWKVIWKIIYAIHNISENTKYGQVNVLIENNIVRFIRGEHADKLNEPVLLLPEEELAPPLTDDNDLTKIV